MTDVSKYFPVEIAMEFGVQYLNLHKTLKRLLFLGATIQLFQSAQACSPGPGMKRPTEEEQRTSAELVVSGTLVDMLPDPAGNLIRGSVQVEKYIRGSGPAVLPISATLGDPCGFSADYRFLAGGQRWTLYLGHQPKDPAYPIASLDTFCPLGMTPHKDGPVGLCETRTDRLHSIGRLRIGPGSIVVYEPNQRIEEGIWSATLGYGSGFADFWLPKGTIAWGGASSVQLVLTEPYAIGPIGIEGHVSMTFFDKLERDANVYIVGVRSPKRQFGTPHYYHGAYRHVRDGVATGGDASAPPGKLTLYGGNVESIRFTMPGPKLLRADLDQPTVIKGYSMQTQVLFAPDGEIESFHSGSDQTVAGRQVRKCDSVRMYQGKVMDETFWNVCLERQTPPLRPRR